MFFTLCFYRRIAKVLKSSVYSIYHAQNVPYIIKPLIRSAVYPCTFLFCYNILNFPNCTGSESGRQSDVEELLYELDELGNCNDCDDSCNSGCGEDFEMDCAD